MASGMTCIKGTSCETLASNPGGYGEGRSAWATSGVARGAERSHPYRHGGTGPWRRHLIGGHHLLLVSYAVTSIIRITIWTLNHRKSKPITHSSKSGILMDPLTDILTAQLRTASYTWLDAMAPGDCIRRRARQFRLVLRTGHPDGRRPRADRCAEAICSLCWTIRSLAYRP
jgi:hypothetical protein